MALLRLDPAGRTIVPDATPPATGILKINAVGMSGAVTSATRVATAAPDRSALSRSLASAGWRGPSVGSLWRHDSPSVDTRAAASHRRRVRSTRRFLSDARSTPGRTRATLSNLRGDAERCGP